MILQANWRWGYWVPDMTVKCFHSWHLGFSVGLGLPLLLLVAVVIPFLPIFLLFKYRTRLVARSVKLRLGFVYHSYRCACASAYGRGCPLQLTLAAGVECGFYCNGSLNADCVVVGLNIGLSSLSFLSGRQDFCSPVQALQLGCTGC